MPDNISAPQVAQEGTSVTISNYYSILPPDSLNPLSNEYGDTVVANLGQFHPNQNLSNMFLASVGDVEIFKRVDNNLLLIANAKTLTENSLRFSVQKEDIASSDSGASTGAFFHNPSVEISLTDVMFNLDYLGFVFGEAIEGNPSVFSTELIDGAKVRNNCFNLCHRPAYFGDTENLRYKAIWVSATGKNDWYFLRIEDRPDNLVDISPLLSSGLNYTNGLCVKYFRNRPEARKISFGTKTEPDELVLVIKTKIFSGNCNSPETGKPVGELQSKVSRYQLNGNIDLSSAMSGVSNMTLEGTVEASFDSSCDPRGTFIEFSHYFYTDDVFNGLELVLAPSEGLHSYDVAQVFLVYSDHNSLVDCTEEFVQCYPSLQGDLWGSSPFHFVTVNSYGNNYRYVGIERPDSGDFKKGDIYGSSLEDAYYYYDGEQWSDDRTVPVETVKILRVNNEVEEES